MEIIVCPSCQIRVAVGDDATCPSCRRQLNDVTRRDTPAKESSIASANENAKRNAVPHKHDQRESVSNSAETHFDVFSVCFSLKGRLPRSVYWFAGIGTALLFYFGAITTAAVLGKESSTASIVLLLFLLLFFWSQVAISVKRFHDFGMSGFWFLLLCFPGIGQLVQFLLLGLQRGEHGENKYGRDPLELFE